MKVKQLRLLSGCYALKGHDNIMASPTVTIERIGGGDYMVFQENQLPIVLGAHRVDFASVEPEDKPAKK